MRKVDYWLGVPLCACLSIFNYILRHLRKASPPPIHRVLFIELSEMGSAILAHSAIMQVKRLKPEADIFFLIFAKNQESAKLLGVMPEEHVLVIDDRSLTRFIISTIKMLVRLHRLRIDTVIDLELFSRCTALLSFLSGASRVIGFDKGTNEGLYRGNFITHPVPYNPHLHIALNFLALVEALTSDPSQVPLVKAELSEKLLPLPTVVISTEEREGARMVLETAQPGASRRKLLLCNPDPGDALPLRGWPIDRFIETCKTLLKDDPEYRIVFIGLKSSQPLARRIMEAVGPENCVDITGKTSSLRALLAVVSMGKLLLTNDSGPAHIATLTEIPIVVLFGPETPALYGPLSKNAVSLFARYSCSPCLSALNHRLSRCNDNKCLQAITVDTVVQECRTMLGSSSTLRILTGTQ